LRRAILLAAAAALIAAGAPRALAQPAPTQSAQENPPGFDHVWHEGYVAVAGAEPIDCQHCHVMDAKGRIVGAPGHSACFGSCHGKAPARRNPRRGKPYPIPDERLPFCTPCHAPSPLKRVIAGAKEKLAVPYPPYRLELDYSILLSHARHDAPANKRDACLTCHAVPGAKRPGKTTQQREVHVRCTPCHLKPEADVVPGMEACTACHRAAFGPATTPHRVPGKYPVAGAFSHQKHLQRARTGAGAAAGAKSVGASCRPCHVAVTKAEGEQIPSPTTTECAPCHDGKTAFSTVGAGCRKCHSEPTERVPRPPLPEVWPRFLHTKHVRDGLQTPCRCCHGLDADGAPTPASPDHQPCSSSGCHAAEFSSLAPTICLSCHSGAEPWRPLHTERRPPPETEFGAAFSHRQHLGGDSPLLSVSCASCHRVTSASRDMRLPRDHSSCTGSSCHGDRPTPKPSLTDCEGCHRPGLTAARLEEGATRAWSVRKQFRHPPHLVAHSPGTQPTACTTCHESVATSAKLEEIGPPAKAICASCHNGGTAFKITGHGCVRCHGK